MAKNILKLAAVGERLLRVNEWSRGNGQCPVCNGISPKFYDSSYPKPAKARITRETGHRLNCSFATQLRSVGLRAKYVEAN